MKTATLLRALGLAKPSLAGTDSVLPILSHFCFDDEVLYSYNDIIATVVEEATSLSCALHGDTLIGILEAAGAEDVTVKVDNNGAHLDVGNGWVKVPALPSEDFIFSLPDEEPIVSIPFSDELAKGLERCLISVGADALKPEFAGVTLRANKDGTVLYSSDNVTASRYNVGKFIGRTSVATVLPADACTQFLKLRGTGSKISIGEKAATMEFEGGMVVTKLLQAKAEQFDEVFQSRTNGVSLFITPPELARELAKASVLLSKESVKDCTITIAKGKATISASGVLGSMKTTISVADPKASGTVLLPPASVARILPHTDQMGIQDGRSLVFAGGGLTHIISSGNTKPQD